MLVQRRLSNYLTVDRETTPTRALRVIRKIQNFYSYFRGNLCAPASSLARVCRSLTFARLPHANVRVQLPEFHTVKDPRDLPWCLVLGLVPQHRDLLHPALCVRPICVCVRGTVCVLACAYAFERLRELAFARAYASVQGSTFA